MRLSVFLCTLSVVLLSLIGCGSSKTASVTGTVTLDGQPVARAGVAFQPKDGGRMSTGETDAAGKFTLTCYERGDGAIPGAHDVTVTKFEIKKLDLPEGADELTAEFESSRAGEPKKKWIVPQKYSDKNTSGLTFNVEKGRNKADLALQSE